ncbi:MAG: hypothetical protein ACE5D0_07270 [Fidelibacterota bacterium]
MIGTVGYLYNGITSKQIMILSENTGNINNPVFNDYEIINLIVQPTEPNGRRIKEYY